MRQRYTMMNMNRIEAVRFDYYINGVKSMTSPLRFNLLRFVSAKKRRFSGLKLGARISVVEICGISSGIWVQAAVL